jgi:hypothetical protein
MHASPEEEDQAKAITPSGITTFMQSLAGTHGKAGVAQYWSARMTLEAANTASRILSEQSTA